MKLGVSIPPEGWGERDNFMVHNPSKGGTASAFLFPNLINCSLVPSLESASKAQKDATYTYAMDDRPTNAGFHPWKLQKNFLSKALKMLNEIVEHFFSTAHAFSPLVKADRHLTCQEALYHVYHE